LLFRKTITIPIIEEESYEKNVVMYVNLGEPKHIAGLSVISKAFAILKFINLHQKLNKMP